MNKEAIITQMHVGDIYCKEPKKMKASLNKILSAPDHCTEMISS